MVAATQEIQQVIENTESLVAKEPALEIAVAAPTPVVEQPVAELRENQVIDIDVLVEQATSMIRNGEPKSALELLSPHLKTIAAEHAGAWRIAGGAMARLELDSHAISALEHAQSIDPNQGSGWFNLGSIHQRQGNDTQAVECYMKAMNVQTDYLKVALKCS